MLGIAGEAETNSYVIFFHAAHTDGHIRVGQQAKLTFISSMLNQPRKMCYRDGWRERVKGIWAITAG